MPYEAFFFLIGVDLWMLQGPSRSWLSDEELPVDDINIDLEDPAANESSDDEVVGLLEYATEAHSALEQT